MEYELIISDSALSELSDIVVYIAQSSMRSAQKYKSDIMGKLANLEKDPYLGKPHTIDKLRQAGYRKLIIGSHTAHYVVDEDKKQVNIIRILHGAMDEKKQLKNL